MSEYKETMEVYRSAVEEDLENCCADQSCPQRELFQAMRYSLLAGGKRIRPVLTLEFCRLCGGDWRRALPFAAAIETVSYTHLDVYKRQAWPLAARSGSRRSARRAFGA